MNIRKVEKISRGIAATDGAGVELTRVIGSRELNMLDPFLLLDVFRSDDPNDYIAGFPPHPHRGFETVTYLLNGRMRHKDNQGHEGVIEPGGIQWMTAGKGIVHSEMPEQENGLLEGFQLWINLPASHKMVQPEYQEYDAGKIPVEKREGVEVRVITGRTNLGANGPVSQPLTEPLYLDVSMTDESSYQENVPADHNVFVFVFKGAIRIQHANDEWMAVATDELAVLGAGDTVSIEADKAARFLLVAGKPLGEPVARGGPFVMNSQDEIMQAFEDYRSGNF